METQKTTLPKINKMLNTEIYYLPFIRRGETIVYLLIIVFIISVFIALPIVQIPISVVSQGITRPLNERTEVKTVISGIIDSLYIREGGLINKDSVLLRLKDPITKNKKLINYYQINQHKQYVNDLRLLTGREPNESLLKNLKTAVYKQELSRYLHQKADQDAT